MTFGAELLAMKANDAVEAVHGRPRIVAANSGSLVAKCPLGLCIVSGRIVVCCVGDKTRPRRRGVVNLRDVVERACMRR